jgi:hypothetical protein
MRSRLFTPELANKSLPLVRKIVADILETGKELKKLGLQPESDAQEQGLEEAQDRLSSLFHELAQIGCSFRDWNFEIGLVDFPAVIDDQEVLLCWRSDEDCVEWYHGIHDGFAGRKPIPEALLPGRGERRVFT